MADTKISNLSENTDAQGSDLLAIVDDPGGTPATEKVTIKNAIEAVNTFDANTDPQGTDELLILDDPGGTLLGEKITLSNLLLATSDIIPAALVYNDADQAIANTAITDLAFNSELYDTDTIHDTSTNNERLTCKTAGKYFIWANLRWESDSTASYRRHGIMINGTTNIGYYANWNDTLTIYVYNIIAVYDLAVNDYVTVNVRQSSGGSLDVGYYANYSPFFGMIRIGD